MKRTRFNLNADVIRRLAGRVGRIGLKPRVLAVVLMAATAAYAFYDLAHKISNASVAAPRAAKQAGKKPAKSDSGTASIAKKPAEAYRVIATRNLFGSTDKESAGTGGGKASLDRMEKTALQLDLIGTVAGESAYSRAIINDPEQKKPHVFKVGDQLGNATIVKIMRRSVVLNVDGREEVLMMKMQRPEPVNPQPDRPISVLPRPSSSGDRIPAGASARPRAGADIKELVTLTQARPHFEGGKMDGYYLGNVEEGSLLKRFGLQSGDVVEGINERTFTKPEDINQLQNMNFSPGTKNMLKVKRDGRSITLNLD